MILCRYCAEPLRDDQKICCQPCFNKIHDQVKAYENMFWSATTYDATDQLTLFEHPLMKEILDNKTKLVRLSLLAGMLGCTKDGIVDHVDMLQAKLASKEAEVERLKSVITSIKTEHDHADCIKTLSDSEKIATQYKSLYNILIRDYEDFAKEHHDMREKGEKRIKALKHALNGISDIINNLHHTELAMCPKIHDIQELIKEVYNIG